MDGSDFTTLNQHLHELKAFAKMPKLDLTRQNKQNDLDFHAISVKKQGNNFGSPTSREESFYF